MSKSYIRTPETRRKNSIALLGKFVGKNHWNFGKKILKLTGKNNPMFGKKRPDVSLRNKLNHPFKGKIRLNFRGKNHPFFGKKRPEHSKRMSGSNHPLFNKHIKLESRIKMSLSHGGTGIPHEYNKYPSAFNWLLRRQIRERDNFTCQNCNKTEQQEFKKLKKILSVHHIDYNKDNYKESNLITLCQKCNTIANFNRDYWFAFYTYKIENFIYVS